MPWQMLWLMQYQLRRRHLPRFCMHLHTLSSKTAPHGSTKTKHGALMIWLPCCALQHVSRIHARTCNCRLLHRHVTATVVVLRLQMHLSLSSRCS